MENFLLPDTVNELKKLELMLACLSEYFTFKTSATLATAVEDSVAITTRKMPLPLWGEKTKAEEAITIVSVVAESLHKSRQLPSAFSWAYFVIDAFANPIAGDFEKYDNWGPTKTSMSLHEIRHFVGLLN